MELKIILNSDTTYLHDTSSVTKDISEAKIYTLTPCTTSIEYGIPGLAEDAAYMVEKYKTVHISVYEDTPKDSDIPLCYVKCTHSGMVTVIDKRLESIYDAKSTTVEPISTTMRKFVACNKEDLGTAILSKKMSDIDDMLSGIAGIGSPKGSSKLAEATDIEDIIEYINTNTKATVSKPDVKLKDYICVSNLKLELNEIKEFMENFKTYRDLGIDIPNGILFKGEPGTGKTYAAKCIAGDTDCYFLSCTASSLQGQYIGSGTQNIKTLFDAARKLRELSDKGVIIFIDELDSLGSRETHSGGASDESDRTLNQLLAEMDGFENLDKVMVMAATNYVNRIDDALLRSGRFSRQITISLPTDAERLNLVEYYFTHKLKMPLDSSVSYLELADITESLSPADIKEIANESAILSVRNKQSAITIDCINEAINKVITKNIRNTDDKYMDVHLVSAHEAGHVLTEILLFNTHPIKVTSYSYGDAGGFTQSTFRLRGLNTKEDFINNIKVLLGGRAAEQVIEGKITNGASNDLEKAKRILKRYYDTYLFEKYDTEKLNQIVIDNILNIYDETVKLLTENKDKLTAVTESLYKNRILYKKDLEALVPADIKLKLDSPFLF